MSQTGPAYLQGALQPAALPSPSVGDGSVGRGESGYEHLKCEMPFYLYSKVRCGIFGFFLKKKSVKVISHQGQLKKQ